MPRIVSRARLVALTLIAAAAACAPAYPPPPETRQEPVVDTIHGVEIADPYRWLEDQESAETRAWIDAQNAYAATILEAAAPIRERFRTRLAELMDRDDVGSPMRAGDRQLFTLRRAGEPVARIVSRPAPAEDAEDAPIPADGDYEVVVDPLQIRADGTTAVSIADVSADGSLLVYTVRDGGRDEVSVHVRDLATGDDLPDVLPQALYGGVRFDASGEGLVYVHRSRENGPRLRRHLLGTPLTEDATIFGDGLPPTCFLSARPLDDTGQLLVQVQHGWRRGDAYLLPVADDGITPTGPARAIVEGRDSHFDFRWHEGRLWARTDLEAPNGRIVVLDPEAASPEEWEEVVPEADDALATFTFIGDRIYATYIHEVAHVIRVFELDGAPAGQIEVPPYSHASIRPAGDRAARLSAGSDLSPETTWSLDLETGERTVYEEPDVSFDATGLTLEQLYGTSADGTRVPLYVMHREGVELDGGQPTLLTGYGGFTVALMPRFSALGAAWVEAGGVYAVANLRGGSEYGDDWHRDGMLANKQHVFDDFIAAAEKLIADGYTNPRRLAIAGTSNGGLLMGAVLTQRPDLFRAAYVGFPDLDMVRFYTFRQTNNAPALLEYGDASDPEQFEFLRRYSPYQAVQDDTDYPAVMLATGDLDTRVPPLQARRMTARLQAATSSGLPVILRYDPRAGHAGGRTRQTSVDNAAAELAFLWWQLGGS